MRRARCLVAFVGFSLVSAVVRAGDPAAAEALFRKGVDDMSAGRFATACPAIAESQRLDPRPGVLFTLAECHALEGRIATAVAGYMDFLAWYEQGSPADRAPHEKRAEIARAQLDKLKADVPKLTLVLPADAPAGTVVTRDGTDLGAPSLGVALPVDPGEHAIVVVAPGRARSESRVAIARGENKVVNVALGPVIAPPPASAPVSPPSSAPPPPSTPNGPRSSEGSSTRATIGRTSLVVGGVGVAVGLATGLVALTKKKTIDAECQGTICTQTGKDAADSAKAFGVASTIAFGVGLVGVGVGAVLLLGGGDEAPKSALRAAPVVGSGTVGAALSGAF